MVRESTPGFSLMELMVAMAVFSVIMVVSSVVWVSALNLWEAEQSQGELTSGLRSTAWRMSQELASAVAADRASLEPPVAGLIIDPGPGAAITFQKPLSTDETQWSGLITIRHRNEDENGNLKRDYGEDLDENGVADRVVERLEDLNGDGAFTGSGETTVLGRSIDAMAVALAGDQLTVTLTARTMGSRQERIVDHDVVFRVRLLP